jgi:hypothetical protein
MANEFIIKNGYFSQGSSNVTGSLTVTAGVTASLQGTASWSNNAITSSYIVTAQTASYVLNAVSSSFATNAQTASFITTAQTASYVLNAVSSSFSSNAATASFVTTAQTASYVLNAVSASFATSASRSVSASRADSAVTASYVLNAVSSSFSSNAVTASFITTAQTASYVLNAVSSSFSRTASFVNTLNQNVTVSGSLIVTNDFVVQGSASIVFITSSQLNIADNIISVNTIQPGVRFGGLAVIDSGSTPQVSGSLLFDSQNNQWIFVHQSAASAAVTSSTVIVGPQTFNNIGNETGLTTNRIPKAAGVDLGEHITDSNITDTGTTVSINSNTQVTGSLTATLGITASLFGTASWAQRAITASFITTAQTASYVLNAVSSSFASTASFITTAQTASYVLNAVSSSFASTASFLNSTTNAFIQGGNSFGATALLGTNDTQNLNIETNGLVRMSISSSGQVVYGSNPLLILSGGLFEGVSPFMEIQTGTTQSAYNEAVILRHNSNLATAATRSLGLLIKLSSENMPNEAVKMGGMILRSTNTFSNSPDLHFVTANTERMTITAAGNIGIGTTAPNAKVRVDGNVIATSFTGSITGSVTGELTGTASFATSASNALTASYVNPLVQDVIITGSLVVSSSGTTNDFRVGTNDLFVSASGNVGIGTTTPTQGTLQVNGNVFATSFTGSITGSVTGTLTGTASFATSASFLTSNTNAFIQGGNSFGTTALLGTNDTRDLSLETAGTVRLTISGSGGEVGIGQAPTTGFRVAANGTIGIFAPAGSPTGSLYIDHTGVQSWKIGVSASSTSTLSIGNDLGGAFANKPFNITNAGNVGIGTTTPTQGTLQVAGNVFATSFTGSLFGTASFATSASFLTSNTNAFIQGGNSFGTTALLGTNDTQNLNFETNGSVRMTISGSDGAIGISATPRSDTRLYVTESSKLYGFYTLNTANNGTAIFGQVINGTGTSIGVYGQAQSAVGTTNIGLYGLATNATNNYAARLQDGSEGIGKVLVSQTATGDANWSTRLTGNYEITGSLIVSASGTTNDFRVGNNKLFVSASGNVAIGTTTLGATDTERLLVSGSGINTIVGRTNVNNYTQLNIVNSNAGTAASADIVATNNTGNESGNFINMGINSSGYTGGIVGVANESYLYNTGSQLWIGNATPGASGNVNIFAGNLGTSTVIFVSSSQRVGINKITPNAVLDVNGNTIITGSLSVTSVGNNTGSFVTLNGNNTLNSRTAAQTRVDINYYGLTYAMQNGYY